MLQEVSSGSVKIISLQREALLEALQAISGDILRAEQAVKEIWLFGSVARGDQVGVSDADILIVEAGDGPPDRLRAAVKYLAYFALPVGVDLLVAGEREVSQRLAEGDPFLRRVRQEGRQLAAR